MPRLILHHYTMIYLELKLLLSLKSFSLLIVFVFQVIDYSLVIEGMPGRPDHPGLIENKLFSCRSVFHSTQLAREVNLTVYVYFFLGSATCRNIPFYPHKKEQYQRPESGIFHMLYVTHKFPVLQKACHYCLLFYNCYHVFCNLLVIIFLCVIN